MTDINFPEAGAVCFTSFKRTDGFVINITLRDKTGAEVLKRMDGAIIEIKKQGGVPYEKKSGFPKKVVEYTGEMCPLCKKGRLVKPTAPNRPIKCEFGKYDYATKKTIGCTFVKWDNVKSGFEQDMGGGN